LTLSDSRLKNNQAGNSSLTTAKFDVELQNTVSASLLFIFCLFVYLFVRLLQEAKGKKEFLFPWVCSSVHPCFSVVHNCHGNISQ